MMNTSNNTVEPSDALEMALSQIKRVRFYSLVFFCFPIVTLAAVLTVWRLVFPERASDLFVIVILSLFAVGQILALFQFWEIFKGSLSTAKVIRILKAQGMNPDMEALRQELQEKAPDSYLRDLLLKWIFLSLKGEVNGNHRILENTTSRRAFMDDKRLNFHVVLNRVTLKLGFLGTLIGLLLTFSPMKKAILGLQNPDGEMGFVHHIVDAIQGDEYAIFSTLAATALSLLIELLTIQMLTRLFAGFEISDSHVNDWNIMVLQRLGRAKQYRDMPDVIRAQSEMVRKAMQVYDAVDKNMNLFMGAVESTGRQLEKLTELQEKIGRRVEELAAFEKQYRQSIHRKGKDAPGDMRPDYFNEE